MRGFAPETITALMENAQSLGFDISGPNEKVIGDPIYIARAVEYVLSHPATINIEEIVIRPPVSIDI